MLTDTYIPDRRSTHDSLRVRVNWLEGYSSSDLQSLIISSSDINNPIRQSLTDDIACVRKCSRYFRLSQKFLEKTAVDVCDLLCNCRP